MANFHSCASGVVYGSQFCERLIFADCPADPMWVRHGSKYYGISDYGMTFSDAGAYCVAHGGKLASIHTEEGFNAVATAIGKLYVPVYTQISTSYYKKGGTCVGLIQTVLLFRHCKLSYFYVRNHIEPGAELDKDVWEMYPLTTYHVFPAVAYGKTGYIDLENPTFAECTSQSACHGVAKNAAGDALNTNTYVAGSALVHVMFCLILNMIFPNYYSCWS